MHLLAIKKLHRHAKSLEIERGSSVAGKIIEWELMVYRYHYGECEFITSIYQEVIEALKNRKKPIKP